MSKNTTRVQFELSENAMIRLKAVKARTEATSYAEVFKTAVILYEQLLNAVDNGDSIIVRSNDDSTDRELFLIRPNSRL